MCTREKRQYETGDGIRRWKGQEISSSSLLLTFGAVKAVANLWSEGRRGRKEHMTCGSFYRHWLRAVSQRGRGDRSDIKGMTMLLHDLYRGQLSECRIVHTSCRLFGLMSHVSDCIEKQRGILPNFSPNPNLSVFGDELTTTSSQPKIRGSKILDENSVSSSCFNIYFTV